MKYEIILIINKQSCFDNKLKLERKTKHIHYLIFKIFKQANDFFANPKSTIAKAQTQLEKLENSIMEKKNGKAQKII